MNYTYTFLNQVLFRYPKTTKQYWFCAVALISCYLVGIVYWLCFFNGGNLSLNAYDWIKESAYLDTLRTTQSTGVIPWKWNVAFYHNTQKFLANPEIILTPDIVLLRWISNCRFIISHIIILYTIGFFGSLLIARKFKLSLVSLIFYLLVFNFNGYLTSHLAIGHFQWTGYFFLPFFFLIMFRFSKDSCQTSSLNKKYTIWMGVILGVLVLNGSFHIALWCSMFMLITLLWRWAIVYNIIVSIIIGGLLGAGRILPAYLFFPEKGSFISGYPSSGILFEAFTSHHVHDFKKLGVGAELLGWWEYDIFIGFAALIIMIFCTIFAFKHIGVEYQGPMFISAGIFFLLSLGNVYSIISKIPVSFANIERVSSRFIIMPFLLLLIISARGIDELLRSGPKICKIIALILVPVVAVELMIHSFLWKIDSIERSVQQFAKPELSIIPYSDFSYALSVYSGWLVSLFTLLVLWIVIIFRKCR